jgi:RHS repeat-associated protein
MPTNASRPVDRDRAHQSTASGGAVWIALILAVFGIAARGHAQTMDLERQMRRIQARHWFQLGAYISWPNNGAGTAAAYPPDGYYADSAANQYTRAAMNAAMDEFDDLFGTHGGVYGFLDAASTAEYLSGNEMSNTTTYYARGSFTSFNTIDVSSTLADYQTNIAILDAALPVMKHVRFSTSIGGYGGTSRLSDTSGQYSHPVGDCTAATASAAAEALSNLASATPPSNELWGLAAYEKVVGTSTNPISVTMWKQTSVHTLNLSGRSGQAQLWMSAVGHSGGSATGGSNDIPLDGEWYHYLSFTGGKSTTYQWGDPAIMSYVGNGSCPGGGFGYSSGGWRANGRLFMSASFYEWEDALAGAPSLSNLPATRTTNPPGQQGEGSAFGLCPTTGDPHPATEMPVVLSTGHKSESATDLSVSVTGQDFQLVREYTSEPAYLSASGDNLFGKGWSGEIFRQLRIDSPTTGLLTLDGPSLRQHLIYTETATNSGIWTAGGPTNQTITRATINIDGTIWPVFRLSEPGRSDLNFYRAKDTGHGDPGGATSPATKMRGLLAQERDIYGNTRTYQYYTGFNTPRVRAIYLNGTPEDVSTEAQVLLTWNLSSGPAEYGMVSRVEVRRFDGVNEKWVTTDIVDYTYASQVPGGVTWSSDIGSGADLVQVTKQVLVDDGPQADDNYWTTVTQYRYHDGNTPSANNDDRLLVDGAAHQLKSVIAPEQIEYYAQQTAGGAGAYDTVTDAAATLLTEDDGDTVFTEDSIAYKVVDLSAKILSYETSGDRRVAAQYAQSACGCGGATQGVKSTYDYYDHSPELTTKVAERLFSGSHTSGDDYSTVYRTTSYDLHELGSANVPYLENKAIIEPGGRTWVWHYRYDSNRNLELECTPAAMSTYTPGSSGTSFSYTANGTGLVHAYKYDSNNQLTEVRVGQGIQTYATDYALVERTTYGSTNDATHRTYLPDLVERVRVDGATGATPTIAASDIEATTYGYGFHTADSPSWIGVSVEREASGENGPGSGTVYSSYELYDRRGNNIWSVAPDGSLTFRRYELGTGQPIDIVANADPSGAIGTVESSLRIGHHAGLSAVTQPGQWGRFAAGGSLRTTLGYDQLGRLKSTSSPNGVKSYVVRDLEAVESRVGVLYLRELSFPHQLDDLSFAGPVSATWYGAGGKLVGQSSYTLDSSQDFDPLALDWTVEATTETAGEVSRQRTRHGLAGLIVSQEVWNDVYRDESYTSTFDHDRLGRTEFVTNSNGTITQSVYDVLDRSTETKVGTIKDGGSANMQSVEVRYFDDDLSGSPVQGMGNGNITLLHRSTGDNGTLAAADRDSEFTYDYRDRLIETLNPAAPHEYLDYDNLGRVVKRAVFSSDPDAIDDPLADRGAYTETGYSQRGLLYRQSTAIDPTDATPDFLETNTWYDSVGRAVGVAAPSGPAQKTTFDGLGRVQYSYVTDRGGSSADITSDRVVEQRHSEYDDLGHLTRVTSIVRNHDETSVGELGAGEGVPTYVDYGYDSADRLILTVDYGTNDTTDGLFVDDATEPVELDPGDLPDFDDVGFADAVLTTRSYDARGFTELVSDSTSTGGGAVRTTKTIYDDLGRIAATIENYVNGAISWNGTDGRWAASGLNSSEPDVDRITSYVYDGSDNVIQQVAHLPNPGGGEFVQVTEYEYVGTVVGSASTATDSLVASNDLLHETHFPDESTGEPGTGQAYTVAYAYNRLGEVRSTVDQNGTTHTFTRDLLGRTTLDNVTAFGTDVDTTVAKISTSYDDLARTLAIQSKNSSNTVLNGVQFGYNLFGQLEKIYQDHNSAVGIDGSGDPTGDTVVVEYTYDTSDAAGNGTNFTRADTMVYPDGATLYMGYDTSADLNFYISRLRGLSRAAIDPAEPDLVQYDYVGLSMVAVADYTQPDIQLDRTLEPNGERATGGHYPGWDALGRLHRQVWADGGLDENGGNAAVPNMPPIVEETYTYDRAGNRLSRFDARPGAKTADRDLKFEYDALNRLKLDRRGSFDPTGPTFTNAVGGRQWTLDTLGNWAGVVTDANGDGNYGNDASPVARDHNSANELTALDTGGADLAVTYSDTGEMVAIERSGSLTTRCTYDAWGRLVRVVQDAASDTTILENEYNGLNWRSVTRADTTIPIDGLDQQRIMYYDASWRLLEERVDDNWSAISSSVDRVCQMFWGARSIDDAVARRIDANANGAYSDGGDSTWFYLTDALFSTKAVVADTGQLAERVDYDSYGAATHRWADDVNGDGQVDVDDQDAVTDLLGDDIGLSTYDADADIDRDGEVDSDDYNLVSGTLKTALASGFISDRAGPDSSVGFGGYLFNADCGQYTVRHRHYDPTLGRWMARDAAGYSDGSNLFQYVQGSPWTLIDAFGNVGSSPEPTDVEAGSRDSLRNPFSLSPQHFAVRTTRLSPTLEEFARLENAVARAASIPDQAELAFVIARQANADSHELACHINREQQRLLSRGARLMSAIGFGALSVIPGPGEAMDLATISDPNASSFDYAMAKGSLVLSAVSLGFSPNYGTLRQAWRAGDRMLATEQALRATQGARSVRAGAHVADTAHLGLAGGSRILMISERNLQKVFTKHGSDFGMTGNWNPGRATETSRLINSHINGPGVKAIKGTYRGQDVVHYLDPQSGLNVISDPSGIFIGGWKLGPEQINSVTANGRLY